MKVELKQGQRYKAEIELSFFESIVSNSTIESKLVNAGFYEVVVIGDGSSRTAIGVWGKSSQIANIHSQVSNVKEI